ncbi:hypothetical protein ACOMHN_006505 [Nucella lapillus]
MNSNCFSWIKQRESNQPEGPTGQASPKTMHSHHSTSTPTPSTPTTSPTPSSFFSLSLLPLLLSLLLLLLLASPTPCHGIDVGRLCQIRCLQGRGGNLCNCNAFHFSGKRDGGKGLLGVEGERAEEEGRRRGVVRGGLFDAAEEEEDRERTAAEVVNRLTSLIRSALDER